MPRKKCKQAKQYSRCLALAVWCGRTGKVVVRDLFQDPPDKGRRAGHRRASPVWRKPSSSDFSPWQRGIGTYRRIKISLSPYPRLVVLSSTYPVLLLKRGQWIATRLDFMRRFRRTAGRSPRHDDFQCKDQGIITTTWFNVGFGDGRRVLSSLASPSPKLCNSHDAPGRRRGVLRG